MRSRSVNMRREAWKYQNYLKFLFERNIIFPFCSPPSTCRSLVSWSHRIGMNGAAAWQRSALFVWKHQNKCPVKLFSYEPWKFDGLIKRGDGVVGENLQSNLPIILLEDLFHTFWDIRFDSELSSHISTTCCLAMATQAVSYILTLEIPMPQKMAKASRKFSSLEVKCELALSTLLIDTQLS